MIGKVYSGGIHGVQGFVVSVEADVSDGLPGMIMVGSLAASVREAQDRVRTALKNSGFRLPAKKITVNLSPADLRKAGTGYDTAIALAVLKGYGVIGDAGFEDSIFVGELGLGGEIKPVRGIMAMVDEAAACGFKRCFLPEENAREGAVISGIEVAGVSSLRELAEMMEGEREISYCRWSPPKVRETVYGMDFKEVSGQGLLRRATEVAVAGMHNILYVGAAGTGKTMVARRIPTIMPSMTMEEAIQVSKIYSICGLLPGEQPVTGKRPFRSPHHSITAQALIGGGRIPRPGEVSLSSNGVIFLDELAEFPPHILDLLRQPLEERRVTVARLGGVCEFPANCMLAAAMNPCRCGFYPDRSRCRCTEGQVRQYLGKISKPFLDRMDICVEAAPVSYTDMRGGESECSAAIRERVERARERQAGRFKGQGIHFNAQMRREQLMEYCRLGENEEEYVSRIYEKMGLSPRGYERLLKVARTVADLAGETDIGKNHLSEAAAYRSLEEKYWGRYAADSGRSR